MTRDSRLFLLSGAIVALAIGAYTRFVGLSLWPWALDEYYIARAVEFIQAGGIPEFPCGGIYTRGLAHQYLAAGMTVLGVDLAFAVRSVSAAANLLALPGVIWLARRIGGAGLACAVVAVFLFSSWEIEMARFGRMYALYQCLFIYELCLIVRGVADGDRKSLWAALVLGCIGLFVWEGGVFGLVLPFIALVMSPEGRSWHKREWLYAGGCAAALMSAGLYVVVDRRFATDGADYPADFVSLNTPPKSNLWNEHIWSLVDGGWQLVLPLGLFAGMAWIIVRNARRGEYRWYETVVLSALAVSLLAHQFLLALLLAASAALAGWLRKDVLRALLRSRLAVLFALTILYWMALAFWRFGASGQVFSLSYPTLYSFIEPLIGYPAMVDRILFRWFEVMPITTVVLVLGVAASIIHVVTSAESDGRVRSVAVSALSLLVLLVAVALIETPLLRTRYSFFLYPLFLIVAFDGIRQLVSIDNSIAKRAVLVAAAIAFIAVSEDIRWAHIARAHHEAVNYRIGYDSNLRNHLYGRWDFRSPAEYVNAHGRPQDVVITTVAVSADYLRNLDYSYVGMRSVRFGEVSCNRGTRERWSDSPLLYSAEQVDRIIDERNERAVWLVVSRRTAKYNDWEASLLQRYAEFQVMESVDRSVVVLRIPPEPANGSPPST